MRIARLLLALAVSAPCLSAQSWAWAGGFMGGVGQSGYAAKSEFRWSASVPSVVLFTVRPVSDRASMQPEIALTEMVGHSQVGSSALTFTRDNVAMHALVRFSYPTHGAWTPYVLVGPGITVLTGCALELVTAALHSKTDCGDASAPSRVDIELLGGEGVSRTIGFSVISVEARGGLGLRSTAVPDGSGYSRTFSWSVVASVATPVGVPRFLRRKTAARTALPATPGTPADSASRAAPRSASH